MLNAISEAGSLSSDRRSWSELYEQECRCSGFRFLFYRCHNPEG